MSNKNIKWPNLNELKETNKVMKAPYGVVSDFAEAVYEAYDKRLLGSITTAFREENGERKDFCYGVYLIKVQYDDKGPQIKVLEVTCQNDGWYESTVSILYPFRKDVGTASTEEELNNLLSIAVNSSEIKSILMQLLKD